ncbi:MAG: S8 family serine peptidase [Chitinophagales bacterium]|nr:S8 family serine peptidase [Chitinophagales bacterium]
MKCHIVFFMLLCCCKVGFSQTTIYHRYIIEFTDKDNNPFSISDPLQYLSQRAIDRRARQQIPITISDLPINPDYIQQVLNTGVKILNNSKWLNSISIETSDSIALNAIRQFPFVKNSNPIAPRSGKGKIPDKDNAYDYPQRVELFSESDYGVAFHQIDMLRGEILHQRGFRGDGIIITVLDAGFFNAPNISLFDSLYADHRVLGTRSFVTGEEDVYGGATHGCSVLSTMAANQPGIMVGTAPKASFYLFITEDENSEYPIEEHNWAAGAEMADSLGTDLITSSLGYSVFEDSVFNHTYEEMDGNTTMVTRAADMAASKGIIVCSSAGNEGNHPWHYITAPGDADSILTVGATDSTGTITAFSSYGPASDGDLKPNVTAEGIGVYVVDAFSGIPYKSNGTSFSNPIIAGITACLWQAHQEENNMEVIATIQKSASLYYNPNDSMGNGIPNYELADLILSNKTPENLNVSKPVIYPNPFSDHVNVLISSSENENITIEGEDITGRKFFSNHYSVLRGLNYFSFPQMRNLSNGYYFIRFNYGDHADILKVLKSD